MTRSGNIGTEPPADAKAHKRKAWWAPLTAAARAGLFLGAHALIIAILLSAMSALHWLVGRIGEVVLFGRLPFAYLIDATDCVIFVIFAWYGCKEAVSVFRGDEND